MLSKPELLALIDEHATNCSDMGSGFRAAVAEYERTKTEVEREVDLIYAALSTALLTIDKSMKS